LEFLEGSGDPRKIPLVGKVWIFSGTTQSIFLELNLVLKMPREAFRCMRFGFLKHSYLNNTSDKGSMGSIVDKVREIQLDLANSNLVILNSLLF